MPLVTLDAYKRLTANRPYKFSSDEVDYREANGEDKCANCMHLYKRVLDSYGVCEIFRDGEGDDEEPIKDDWVCSFHTVDGEEFPLLKSTDKTSVPRHED
jgi:hypothetical protein